MRFATQIESSSTRGFQRRVLRTQTQTERKRKAVGTQSLSAKTVTSLPPRKPAIAFKAGRIISPTTTESSALN